MNDKIAIISDIHGNLEALRTVLEDIKERDIKIIFCLGDIIAKGTHQHECLELVRNNCEIVIKGNCDHAFSNDIDLSQKGEHDKSIILWIESKLTDEDKDYLKKLPYCYEFYLSGRLVRLFHATPEKIDESIGNINTIDGFYKLFLPSENTISNEKADIVIYGHLHTQFIQKIYNRTIINAGSVGNSLDVFRNEEKDANCKNTTVANYLVLYGNYNSKNIEEKISYELVSLPYDIEKELRENNDNVELEAYKEELRSGKYRNMEKIYIELEERGINRDSI